MKKNQVPNTISDKQMADLKKRAEKVAPPFFSSEATKRRKDAAKQSYKADQS